MKPKTLTLLILTVIVMASVLLPLTNACGTPLPEEVIVVTAIPPPAPAIPSAEDLQQEETAQLLSKKAEALLDTGNNLEAIKVFTQAIELWPHYHINWSRGIAYERIGEYDKACKDYRTALKSDNLSNYYRETLKHNMNSVC